MKRQKQLSRVLSLVLTLSLVIGMLPASALAAQVRPYAIEGEIVERTQYKGMTMTDLSTGYPVARYDYNSAINRFYQGVNMNEGNDGGISLTLLSYTIEKSQYVDLKLYKLKPGTMYLSAPDPLNGDTYHEALLEPDPDDATAKEPFLDGELLGYIHGVRLTNNVRIADEAIAPEGMPKTLETVNQVAPVPLDTGLWCELIGYAVNGLYQPKTIRNDYAFGFDGIQLELLWPEEEEEEVATAALSSDIESRDDSIEETTSPIYSVSQDVELVLNDSEDDNSAPVEVVVEDMLPPKSGTLLPAEGEVENNIEDSTVSAEEGNIEGEDNPEDPDATPEEIPSIEELSSAEGVNPDNSESNGNDASEEPTPVETEAVTTGAEPVPVETEEIIPSEEPKEIPDISSMMSLAGSADYSISTYAAQEDAPIKNYVIWDGAVEKNGKVYYPDYEDDCQYVIVLEPVHEAARLYNSFMAFEQNSDLIQPFICSAAYYGIYLYCTLMGYEFHKTPDPVNLLTGSFSWEYTDMALYGQTDFPFIRRYESSDAAENHGFGLGWTTNFTAELSRQKLFSQVILPGGDALTFTHNADGTYRPMGDYEFGVYGDVYQMWNSKTGTLYTFDPSGKVLSIVNLDPLHIFWGQADKNQQ